MRSFLKIGIAILIAASIVIGSLWIVRLFQTDEVNTQTTQTPLPEQPIGAFSQTSVVRNAFQSSIPANNPDNIKLRETVIADGYALQIWSGDVMGGQALLKYDTGSKRWVVVDLGGGAWSEDVLISFGVPRNTAQSLLEQLSN
jgi:hypothetical protein